MPAERISRPQVTPHAVRHALSSLCTRALTRRNLRRVAIIALGAAILTFHSGEDRLVKQAFRQQYRDRLYRDIAQEVTRPSPQECRRNPRAHSTKLRWAVRAE